MVILEAYELKKTLGYRAVLHGASLAVTRGERVVLLGDNGSGKSTFLQLVAGVLEPDSGRTESTRKLGFAPEKPDFPEHLAVCEWLALVASLKGLRRLGELPFGAGELLGTRTSALSLGQRQRVSLAAAWLGEPDLLVLDEPTNGLDVASVSELERRLVGMTALIATHDRAFARAVGTRVLVMQMGKMQAAPDSAATERRDH